MHLEITTMVLSFSKRFRYRFVIIPSMVLFIMIVVSFGRNGEGNVKNERIPELITFSHFSVKKKLKNV